MKLPLEAHRWGRDDNMASSGDVTELDHIEMKWFSTLPDAQIWIGFRLGYVIYDAPDGSRNFMWVKV